VKPNIPAILGGRVKKESILVLLAHSTKMPKSQVEIVLNAIEDMERKYLK